MYQLAPFLNHHPFQVLPFLREEDVLEADAEDKFVDEALIDSIESSDVVYTIFLEGEPVGFFGFLGTEDEAALIWMVGTEDLTLHPLSFCKTSAEVIEDLLDVYPMLYNKVHEGNKLHIKWLERMGAEFFPSDVPGFINFEIKR